MKPMRRVAAVFCLVAAGGTLSWADSQDPPKLPPSAITSGVMPAAAQPDSGQAQATGDTLEKAFGSARTATRGSTSESRFTAVNRVAGERLTRSIETAYKSAARLAEKYAKDPGLLRCSPSGWSKRRTPDGPILRDLVRPAEGSSVSGAGAIHYVSPGTQSQTLGGSNSGGYNMGGQTVGGGSSGQSDEGGSLFLALTTISAPIPQNPVWALLDARQVLAVIKKDLTACPANTAEESKWRGEAIQSVDDVYRDVDAATQLSRTLYSDMEQRLSPFERRLRGIFLVKP
jgi:hypothetical protein